MSPHSQNRFLRLASLVLSAAALMATGCTSGMVSTGTTSPNAVTGPSFVVGTDAPLAAVTSFTVQLVSVDAIDSSSGNKVSLISGEPNVDFARFNGLQTLLDMNDVPAGTYDSVAITLGTGTIGYLDTTTAEPTIQTEAAVFATPTVTVTLKKPLVIANGGAPAGLRIDFDLAKSIAVDSSGNITDSVTPTFNINAVSSSDSGGHIDEFVAGVVSVNANGQSFVVQGPHGEQFTIDVNGQTEWDGNDSISSLTTSSIVAVAGTMDKADQTLDADEVAILSQNGFYAGGQITYVQPSSGAATSFDLYVRGLLPTTTGLTLGQIATVDLTGNEKYFIYWMHNPLTEFLFNSSALVAGQHVSIGGPASGAVNASDVTTKRVVLRDWGFNGTVVKGSQSASNGTFQMKVNGFAGVLIPETVTVYLGDRCDFRYGFGAFSDLADGTNLRVVGLLLKNPTTGQVVLLARHIDGLDMTNFATVNFE